MKGVRLMEINVESKSTIRTHPCKAAGTNSFYLEGDDPHQPIATIDIKRTQAAEISSCTHHIQSDLNPS